MKRATQLFFTLMMAMVLGLGGPLGLAYAAPTPSNSSQAAAPKPGLLKRIFGNYRRNRDNGTASTSRTAVRSSTPQTESSTRRWRRSREHRERTSLFASFSRDRSQRSRRSRSTQSTTTTKKPTPPAPTYTVNDSALAASNRSNSRVVIDVGKQRAYLLVNDKIAISSPVSTARPGKHTPRGTFYMSERVRSGKISTIYHVAMPYWMRLSSTAYGVHAGYLPGYPASAGCVRLPYGAAQLIYDNTRSGTRVNIYSSWAGN